jgi:copper chaperone
MVETKLKIEGMSCQHCVMAVKKALGGVPAVIESDVQIGSASIKYDDSKVKETDIQTAIEKAGYKVVK